MKKILYRKFLLDCLSFFLISIISTGIIIWVFQAVNFLDLVSDDGHSLNVYFAYVSLSLPKIFSKTIIFVYFISIFYVINKYSSSNELIVFWNNGIKKMYYLANNLKVRMVHVKAHKAEPSKDSTEYYKWYGNMMADKLATKASSK